MTFIDESKITAKRPWENFSGVIPLRLDYFDGTMFEAVEAIAKQYPNNTAFTFMGTETSYKKMIEQIRVCAKSLRTIGVRPGDRVLIAMPKSTQLHLHSHKFSILCLQ